MRRPVLSDTLMDAPTPGEDVYLTIVPADDMMEDDDTCDELLDANGKPIATLSPPPTRAQTPQPPAEPAPRKRSGFMVFLAGAMGGGLVVGGGGAVLGVLALAAVFFVAVLGGGWWWWSGLPDAPAVAEVPAVEEPLVVTDGDAEEAPTGDTRRSPTTTPVSSTPGTADDAPVQDTPREVPATVAPVKPPPAPTVVSDEPAELGEILTVKIISDPPAATLWVDGQPAGRTPAKLDLEAGSYSLTIESGKARETFPIDVGLGADRYCFEAQKKKLAPTTCL
jgi:hypothetical protein